MQFKMQADSDRIDYNKPTEQQVDTCIEKNEFARAIKENYQTALRVFTMVAAKIHMNPKIVDKIPVYQIP